MIRRRDHQRVTTEIGHGNFFIQLAIADDLFHFLGDAQFDVPTPGESPHHLAFEKVLQLPDEQRARAQHQSFSRSPVIVSWRYRSPLRSSSTSTCSPKCFLNGVKSGSAKVLSPTEPP